MARAILHIGTEKTGSSAIQAYLAGNRVALRESGFVYSSIPDGENHLSLAIYAQDDATIDDLRMGAGIDSAAKLTAYRANIEAMITAEVASAPDATFIFSSEHCHSRLVRPGEVERLHALLGRFFDDIVVLVYLRRQDQVVISRHSTAMKAGHTWTKIIDPATIDRRFFDYAALLERWAGVFGRERMAVARFLPEKLVQGSIIPDFCARTGIPLLDHAGQRRNESLRPPHQEFLRRINERLPRFVDGALNPRRGHIEAYVAAFGSGPGRRPARADAHAFYESWRASNEAVRREYFPHTESLFDEDFDAYPIEGDAPDLTIDDALDITADIWAALVNKHDTLSAKLKAQAAQPPQMIRPQAPPRKPSRALTALPPVGGVPRTGSGAVNSGYQRDDQAIVDYQLWDLADQKLRGPRPDLDRPYFATIGAAQVFGRFTDKPFPELIADRIGLPALNLGMSGAGPSFFLQRDEVIAAANRAQFVIVHLLSGRSVSNSQAVLANNQGVMWLRSDPDAPAFFAEDIYRHLLHTLTPAELAELRAENREIYLAETQALLERIDRPKILLYWSKRPVDYAEGLDNLGSYWGDFPHFVNRDVIDALVPFADHYAEVVTDRGLPQPLFDRETGEPILMWPEDRFPNVRQREHNHYYPAPEMHEDVLDALMPAVQQVIGGSAAVATRCQAEPRPVLVHMHIHRNAGTAIDRALQEGFDDRWQMVNGTDAVIRAVEADSRLLAISARQLQFPLPARDDLHFHPLLFLRNPILRALAVYDHERGAWQQAHSDALHTRMANQHDFRAWIEWCLSETILSGPIANLQTRLCSATNNGARPDDWNRPVTLTNLGEATAMLANAAVGTIEDFDAALIRIERALHLTFPRLRLLSYLDAVRIDESIYPDLTPEDLRGELGDKVYDRLCAANAFDLLLWRRAMKGGA